MSLFLWRWIWRLSDRRSEYAKGKSRQLKIRRGNKYGRDRKRACDAPQYETGLEERNLNANVRAFPKCLNRINRIPRLPPIPRIQCLEWRREERLQWMRRNCNSSKKEKLGNPDRIRKRKRSLSKCQENPQSLWPQNVAAVKPISSNV